MPSSTTDWAVVVKWADGSVDVNGPYAEEEYAVIASRSIALDLARDEDRSWQETPNGALVYHGDKPALDPEAIHLFVRAMGTPVEPGE